MTAVEADYRYSLNKKWGLTAYGGIAALCGDNAVDEGDRYYPAGGVGVFYVLNDEKMVVRADIAVGKDGNHGFYLQFGHAFDK